MPLTDTDRQEIANLISSQLGRLREELARGGSGGPTQAAVGQQEARAVTPLVGLVGNWKMGSTGTGSQEAIAQNAPVEFDRLENSLHAGGRVMVTNFMGRTRQNVEAGGARVQQGEQFAGISVLAYDAPNNQYIELYADDQGKVALSTTQRWEANGGTLRLYHDNYVSEYITRGPTEFRFNLYEAGPGRQGPEAARGTPIKTTTLRRH